jgi:hypothetical protein
MFTAPDSGECEAFSRTISKNPFDMVGFRPNAEMSQANLVPKVVREYSFF